MFFGKFDGDYIGQFDDKIHFASGLGVTRFDEQTVQQRIKLTPNVVLAKQVSSLPKTTFSAPHSDNYGPFDFQSFSADFPFLFGYKTVRIKKKLFLSKSGLNFYEKLQFC